MYAIIDERGKMKLIEKGKEIEITPGEYADLIEVKLHRAKSGGGPKEWMNLMGILISGIPAIVQALRVADAMNEDKAPVA